VSQVALGTKRIDLVIDGIVGFECAGEEFHWDKFLPDRQKDRDINLAGYHAMRFAAVMIFYEWPTVLAAIEAAIAARTPIADSGNSGKRSRSARRPRQISPISKEFLSFQNEQE
jgi:very-short-patch-repair endonuclease